MLIVQISNGLGNQLFQYATARAISKINGDSELYLDTKSGYHSDTTRSYLLNRFSIQINGFAQLSSIDCSLNQRHLSVLHRDKIKLPVHSITFSTPPINIPAPPVIGYFSSPLLWDPEALNIPQHTYIRTFGQHWTHLESIRKELLNELSYVKDFDETNLAVLRRIRAAPSASIHVRRSDYTQQGYQLCESSYYQEAIAYLLARCPTLKFYVFTDDYSWVKQQLGQRPDVEVISHNGPTHCEDDLRLMSECDYNIIANSTFSWWAAWLNRKLEKIVIAPKVWKKAGEEPASLLPPDWITL
jgi:hypothetical protein